MLLYICKEKQTTKGSWMGMSKFKVGQKVKVLHTDYTFIKVGDVLDVKKTDAYGVYLRCITGNQELFFYDGEVELVEPSLFKIGDRLVVTRGKHEHRVGDTLIVTEIYGDGSDYIFTYRVKNERTGFGFIHHDNVKLDDQPKFKVGDKVVPTSKSIGDRLEKSVWEKRGKKQGFLYFNGICKRNGYLLCWDLQSDTGDFFLESDLELYVEQKTALPSIGTKVRVIANHSGHQFEIGAIVTVAELTKKYIRADDVTGRRWALGVRDFEPVQAIMVTFVEFTKGGQNYLFDCTHLPELKIGDKVVCDTRIGKSKGTVTVAPFEYTETARMMAQKFLPSGVLKPVISIREIELSEDFKDELIGRKVEIIKEYNVYDSLTDKVCGFLPVGLQGTIVRWEIEKTTGSYCPVIEYNHPNLEVLSFAVNYKTKLKLV